MVDNSGLFEKYKLNNNIEVPARLAVAPMVIFCAGDSGQITDEERSYLAHRATGIGLYISLYFRSCGCQHGRNRN